ncbi:MULTISPECIES: hypothetical protein [Thiorhodovibrio]|uniref:hypothetical protein n=1 Tax=Thiorhodovibrio TaxID=61593 RepID=UPI0019127638|nr:MULTISPECIES: hypothetical protein [Thiorhodovibrio]MBK5968802.1 hypothetical protein [Thiorhodovibrio winogradskyi]WPL12220.1 hypothetical protein Thiosp_01980 [Thiorhodovibrio litoralis]
MAMIEVTADCPARLAGFLEGVNWINDSAVSVLSVDEIACRAVLIDQELEDDHQWQLGSGALLFKTEG